MLCGSVKQTRKTLEAQYEQMNRVSGKQSWLHMHEHICPQGTRSTLMWTKRMQYNLCRSGFVMQETPSPFQELINYGGSKGTRRVDPQGHSNRA